MSGNEESRRETRSASKPSQKPTREREPHNGTETTLPLESPELVQKVAGPLAPRTRSVLPSAPKMPQYLNGNGEFDRSQAACLQYTTWYSVRDLMTTVKSINKINFSIVKQRQQALTSLNGLNDDCPYSITRRFPANAHYVCAGKGDWVRKVQQLRTSLAYKETSFRGGPTPPASACTDANDSCLAFYNACSAIIMQVAQRDFVYDQGSFERDFALTWV